MIFDNTWNIKYIGCLFYIGFVNVIIGILVVIMNQTIWRFNSSSVFNIFTFFVFSFSLSSSVLLQQI